MATRFPGLFIEISQKSRAPLHWRWRWRFVGRRRRASRTFSAFYRPYDSENHAHGCNRAAALDGSCLLTPRRNADAAGFIPAGDLAETADTICDCVDCDKCRAARALQTGDINGRDLAFDDADLQRVISAWHILPTAVRRAVLGLVESQA
jgi:hypothetical protein